MHHWIYRTCSDLFSIESLGDFRVGVISEDLVDPLCVKGHVDEDARLVGSSTASAMDTHSHNNLDFTILTHKRTAIIPLQKKKCTAYYFTSLVENWLLLAFKTG